MTDRIYQRSLQLDLTFCVLFVGRSCLDWGRISPEAKIFCPRKLKPQTLSYICLAFGPFDRRQM